MTFFSPNNLTLQLNGYHNYPNQQKTVAFLSEKRQFFVIPPVGNKSAKLWTQNKTEIGLEPRHFYDLHFPRHLLNHICDSFEFSPIWTQNGGKILKIASFRPGVIKQREAHYNFSSKLKIFFSRQAQRFWVEERVSREALKWIMVEFSYDGFTDTNVTSGAIFTHKLCTQGGKIVSHNIWPTINLP